MDKEIIKAMNKKENIRVKKMKKWWNKNSYKIFRILLFPIWIITLYNKKANEKEVWNEERANEILKYYIPRYCSWDNENQEFYFFDNGYGWSWCSAKRLVKRKDKRFWNVHNGFWGGKIRDYLINNFELDGFEKEVGECSNGWTELTFKMKF